MNREALSEGSRSIQPILPHLHSSQKGTQIAYLPGVKGWADRKGGPAGHKERPRRCEDRGAEREGVSGAGRPLQNPRTGERARPLREQGRGALPPAVEKRTRRRGAQLQLPREGFTWRGQRLKKGFKQENVARVAVHGDQGPKPPRKHLKPERKYNWAATAVFIRGRAQGARVFRSLRIPTP